MDSSNLSNPSEKCTACQKQVAKIFQKFHKSTSSGDTTKKRRKFSDETGRLWHGTKCPDCAAAWRRDRVNKAESEKQEALKKQLQD